LRENRFVVIVDEFFNRIGAQQAFSRGGTRVSNAPTAVVRCLIAISTVRDALYR